jgi:hypothetical protein
MQETYRIIRDLGNLWFPSGESEAVIRGVRPTALTVWRVAIYFH